MATITTDTFLDGGTARTAGESWTANNGAKFTIRTDTRWHANAPASMTGSIGGFSTSTTDGGQLLVTGANVRWMPFDTGSGTVPAIGTTITQGGVSGYLLGVWANYTSAPTAVGAAMPATGFLKFREVTGGPYSAGVLTGISANATSADVTGWIEVVFDQSSTVGSNALKCTLTFAGEWFELGTTTGSPGQTVQLPTNGGGSGTTAEGIQIETAPGSGVYEWYHAVNTTYWTSSYFNTDLRNKCVESAASGLIRIGATSGGTNVGFTPPSGCKIRSPNVFLRQCTTGARASNAVPNTTATNRPRLFSAGLVSLSKISFDWFTNSSGYPTSFSLVDCCFEKSIAVSACPALTISNSVSSQATTGGLNNAVDVQFCAVAFDKFFSWTSGSTSMNLVACSGTLTDCGGGAISTSAGNQMFLFSNASNLTLTRMQLVSGGIAIGGDNFQIIDTDYVARTAGDVTSSGTTRVLTFQAPVTNAEFSGLTFGKGGTLSMCHPYSGVLLVNGALGPVVIKNIGTSASPLNVGATPSLYPRYVVEINTSPSNKIKIKRVYVASYANGFISYSGPGSSDLIVQNCGSYDTATFASTMPVDSVLQGVASSNTMNISGFGNNWFDFYIASTNTGYTKLRALAPSGASAAYTTLVVTPSVKAGFETTQLSLPTSGDYCIFEMPSKILGHASFKNTAATISSSGSLTYEYQIDTGSGWNGTWKTVNGTNLSAETISPSAGYKLKVKVTATATGANLFNSLLVTTDSSATDRLNLYPLDTNTLEFTNLVAGSEVRAYTGTDPATAVEIGGTESSGTSFSFTHSAGGTPGFIRIFAMGYQPVNYDPYTFPAADTSLLVQQTIDRNYVNP